MLYFFKHLLISLRFLPSWYLSVLLGKDAHPVLSQPVVIFFIQYYLSLLFDSILYRFLCFSGFNLLYVDVRLSHMQVLTTEVVVQRCSTKEQFQRFCKSHRKPSVLQSSFNKVACEGLPFYQKETQLQMFSVNLAKFALLRTHRNHNQ